MSRLERFPGVHLRFHMGATSSDASGMAGTPYVQTVLTGVSSTECLRMWTIVALHANRDRGQHGLPDRIAVRATEERVAGALRVRHHTQDIPTL
jgi:hypothetical protein